METLQAILKLLPDILSVASAIVAFVLIIIKTVKDKNWTLITEIAKKTMSEVDAYAKVHPGLTPDEKLEMALLSIETAMTAAGVKYDQKATERIIKYIKEMCEWSKTVNAPDEK